jgi:hypothetical protein
MLGSTVMLASIIVAMGGTAVSVHCFGIVVTCFHTQVKFPFEGLVFLHHIGACF